METIPKTRNMIFQSPNCAAKNPASGAPIIEPIAFTNCEKLRKLEALSPAGVDINMGCPVKKALSHNWGVALMGNIGYASEVVSITRRHSGIPLSVKMRSGLSQNLSYLLEFMQAMESSGADWMTLHPRLQSQGRHHRAAWETIARARESVRIPVVGNGDVQTADLAKTIELTKRVGLKHIALKDVHLAMNSTPEQIQAAAAKVTVTLSLTGK